MLEKLEPATKMGRHLHTVRGLLPWVDKPFTYHFLLPPMAAMLD